MKFIHTADLHLARSFRNIDMSYEKANIRRNELWNSLDNIVTIAKSENVDAILFCGDIFEREYFTISDMKRFRDVLKELNCEIVMITGNHDFITPESIHLKIQWPDNFYLFKTSTIQYIDFPMLNVRIHASSWTNNIMREELDYSNIEINEEYKNIFMAHGTTSNSTDYLPINVKVLEAYNFDYIALGHIHKGGKVGERSYFSGSPEGFSFNELGTRGINLVTIEGETTVKFIPTSTREYVEEIIELEPHMDYVEIREKTLKLLNPNNIYRLVFQGVIDKDIDLKNIVDSLRDRTFYLDYLDKTSFNIDIEEIYYENQDNIKGLFIEELRAKSLDDAQFLRILQHGLKALEKGDM